jgi:hypothetical protein
MARIVLIARIGLHDDHVHGVSLDGGSVHGNRVNSRAALVMTNPMRITGYDHRYVGRNVGWLSGAVARISCPVRPTGGVGGAVLEALESSRSGTSTQRIVFPPLGCPERDMGSNGGSWTDITHYEVSTHREGIRLPHRGGCCGPRGRGSPRSRGGSSRRGGATRQ